MLEVHVLLRRNGVDTDDAVVAFTDRAVAERARDRRNQRWARRHRSALMPWNGYSLETVRVVDAREVTDV